MTLVDRDGGVADDAICRAGSRATIVVITVVAASVRIDELADGHHHLPFRSHFEIEAVRVLPRTSGGPEPAAVRLKAACRAAGRPDRSGLGVAGPRPARGLKDALLGRKPATLASVRPDHEALVIPPVLSIRARGRAGTGPVRASGTRKKDMP